MGSPYYFYNKVITENFRSNWYFLEDYRPNLINPTQNINLQVPDLGNEDLWGNFHFRDIVIPLPTRNPLYYVAPIVNFDEARNHTRLGVTIYGTGYREISKLYFVNNMVMESEIRSQEIFKLPLVEKAIKESTDAQTWKDIFSKDISDWNIPFSDMAKNLYLLQLRSKLFPTNTLSFGALDSSTGIVTLESKNKDYITELVMTRKRGVVYSYVIVTEKENNESKLLRYKFLRDIKFRPGSESLAGIIYKEFKALPYKRKIEHEGMLYLLSAWSHNSDMKEYLREMIFYLERGEENQKQLEPLYAYSAKRYGKIFTQRDIKDLNLDPEMLLKRNIELEERRELEAISRKDNTPPRRSLSQEERNQERIKEAKKNIQIKRNRMIID